MKAIQEAPIFDRLFIPSGLEEPDLLALCKSVGRMIFGNVVVYTVLTCVFFYFHLRISGYIGTIFCVSAFLSLIFLKLGFTSLFRNWYMGISLLCIGGVSFALGKESFFWVWYFIAIANSYFIILDREKGMRIFGLGGIFTCLVIVLPLLFFDLIPSEVPPNYHNGMINIGIITVVYSTSTLVGFAVRYKRDVNHYKKRIEDQSLTMLQHAKMSSLGEMAAGVAHEVNNPLAMIMGNMSQILREIKAEIIDRSKIEEKGQKILKTVERIAKIVSALRTFSQDTEFDPFQKAKVQEIVEDTLYFCSENLRRNNVELRVHGAPDVDCECRPPQISQILTNLINNSFEATKNLQEKWITLEWTKTDHAVQIAVTDSGSGIPTEIAEKIMQPFFTTKEIGKGTGLGLSIATGIAETHGGRLILNSTCPNTQFVLTLPLRQTVASKEA